MATLPFISSLLAVSGTLLLAPADARAFSPDNADSFRLSPDRSAMAISASSMSFDGASDSLFYNLLESIGGRTPGTDPELAREALNGLRDGKGALRRSPFDHADLQSDPPSGPPGDPVLVPVSPAAGLGLVGLVALATFARVRRHRIETGFTHSRRSDSHTPSRDRDSASLT